jgi:hypothetical protein
MRKLLFVLVTLGVAGSLSASASTSSAKNVVLRTKGHVVQIAADGLRVAVATTTTKENTCDRIVVWSPTRRALAWFKTSANCESGGIGDVPEIALAGKRVAWLEAGGGNSLELGLASRVLGAKKTTGIASAYNSYGAEGAPDGDWIGNLAGHGDLLVYNRWSLCTALPATVTNPDDYGDHCDQPASGSREDYIFSSQKLVKAVGTKRVVIASAPDLETARLKTVWPLISPQSLAVVSVDAGRIATQDPSGAVTVYSPKGAVLAQIAVPSGSFAGTALQGSQLATLRNNKLEVYRVSSGTLVETIPVPTGSVLRDLQNGLAVYVSKRKVHVLRLSDKKNVTYSPPGRGSVDAQIESSGFFYSYNYKGGRSPGRVVFVPFATLLNTLG